MDLSAHGAEIFVLFVHGLSLNARRLGIGRIFSVVFVDVLDLNKLVRLMHGNRKYITGKIILCEIIQSTFDSGAMAGNFLASGICDVWEERLRNNLLGHLVIVPLDETEEALARHLIVLGVAEAGQAGAWSEAIVCALERLPLGRQIRRRR